MAAKKKEVTQTGLLERNYETIFAGDITGIDTFQSAKALKPNMLSDAENVWYDTNYIYNRNGAQVLNDDSEYIPTTPITQVFVGADSRGTQYLLRYWNGNFDVWNDTTKHWYNINPASTIYNQVRITQKTSKWGYVTWNNGYGHPNDLNTVVNQNLGSDILYMGNGVDPMAKWIMANTTTAAVVENGATSIILSDTSEFPTCSNSYGQYALLYTGSTATPIVIEYSALSDVYWNDIFTLNNNPADGDTATFVITTQEYGAVTVTVTFQATFTSGSGHVKIGSTISETAITLNALLNNPTSSNGLTYSGFSTAAEIASIQLLTSRLNGTVITLSESTQNSITSFTASTTTSGNTNSVTIPNVMTLTTPWNGPTVAVGTQLYSPVQSVYQNGAYTVGGKYMKVVNSRLHSAGIKGQETFIYYSALNMPEFFGVIGSATGIDAGGQVEMSDGDGPITGLSITMTYLLIHKRDLINEFFLTEDTVNNDNIPTFVPIATGDSAGAIEGNMISVANLLTYFPTASQGIAILIPSFTYTGTIAFQEDIISIPVQNIVTDAGYTLGDSIYFDGKIWLSVNESGSPDIPDLIVYYDLIRKNWGKIRGWNATSFAEYNGSLVFSGIDTHLYEYDDFSYDDNSFEYGCYAKTAEMAFGDFGMLKESDSIYLTGLLGLDQTMYVDVIYNTNGSLQTLTYKLTGSPTNPYITIVSMPTIGQNMIGINTIGIANNDAEVGIFKVYLTNNVRYEWNTIQLRFYSQDAGSSWAVDFCAMHVTTVPTKISDLHLFPNV